METGGDVGSIGASGDDAGVGASEVGADEVSAGEVGTAEVNDGDASAADVGAADLGAVAPLHATDSTQSAMTAADRRSSRVERRCISAV
ncbi:hypothetical protein [Candidatus Poriferisodalis sp.]|uniref:hypothetical protein n=1 Tax=Candidatus Poriferisodalis sp. TaxID=3101277 RepID=UPI003B01F305